MKMNNTIKLGLFQAGAYVCPVPTVPTGHWVAQDWVNWIDHHGTWTTGWESVDTDTPDPDTITVSLAAVEEQVRQHFETAWRRISSGVAAQNAEGWGYWFATSFMCDAIGISHDQQKEWGK
jgi:hypothetical protein